MNKKIIFIFVALLLIIGAFMLLSNRKIVSTPPISVNPIPIATTTRTTSSAVDTSDWETYRSEKFGYEIKYPKGVELEKNEYEEGEAASGLREGVNIRLDNFLRVSQDLLKAKDVALGGGQRFFSSRVRIQDMKNTEHLPVRQWVVNEGDEGRRRTVQDNGKDIVFAGEPAYYAESVGYGDIDLDDIYKTTLYSIFFFHNGYLFEIGGTKPPPDPSEKWKNHPLYAYFEKYIPISEAIIQSFRFVSTTATP